MKKWISMLLVSVAFVFVLVGCSQKTADPIVLPDIDKIETVEITTVGGSTVSYSDKEWIEQFLSIFTQATATSKQSVQDCPNVDKYGKVDISNNGGITTVFYYAENGKYYIEQPYQGIYETDVDIDAFVSGIE